MYRVSHLQDAVLVLDVQEVVLACVRGPRRGRLLRGARKQSAPLAAGRLLKGEDVGEAREHRLGGEGQRLGALFDRMQHVQNLRVPEALELAHRASEDFGYGLFAFRLVQLLGAALFEQENRALL